MRAAVWAWRVRFVAVITLGVFGFALAQAAGQPGGWDGGLASADRCFNKGLGCPEKIDWQKFGFPFTVAQIIVQPDEAVEVTLGDTRIDIPVGAFGAHPVRFTLLTGQASFFQPYAPAGQRVIGKPYTYEVVDVITGHHMFRFQKPLVYSLTRPEVSTQSVYWDTSSTSPLQVEKNPTPAKIMGHTLTHINLGAAVGWFVTSPQ